MPAKHELPSGKGFDAFTFLELNERGMFVDRPSLDSEEAPEVPASEVADFLRRHLVVPKGTTDVFVWVHGWRNDLDTAIASGRRLFNGILLVSAQRGAAYPNLSGFAPAFVAVHWPSMSPPSLSGYSTIRDRAHAMTTDGAAEFVLASLLGYLEAERPSGGAAMRPTMRSKFGFYVHCVGHSFGGRFLAQAINAAASPSAPTLALLLDVRSQRQVLSIDERGAQFAFSVDTLTVFQMAAPNDCLAAGFHALISDAPLRGPICLTHSSFDRATCFWHNIADGARGIGCTGPIAPAEHVRRITLREATSPYPRDELQGLRVTSVDATWAFDEGGFFSVTGAHSDIWYEESIHLILSAADATR